MITRLMLFFTAMLQVTFVAMNVIFLGTGKLVFMGISGFMISLLWTLNVKKVAFGGWTDRFIYASGAMAGTYLGYLVSHLLIDTL